MFLPNIQTVNSADEWYASKILSNFTIQIRGGKKKSNQRRRSEARRYRPIPPGTKMQVAVLRWRSQSSEEDTAAMKPGWKHETKPENTTSSTRTKAQPRGARRRRAPAMERRRQEIEKEGSVAGSNGRRPLEARLTSRIHSRLIVIKNFVG